jgi:hypothetical protein
MRPPTVHYRRWMDDEPACRHRGPKAVLTDNRDEVTCGICRLSLVFKGAFDTDSRTPPES